MKRILQVLVINGLLEPVPSKTIYIAVYQLTNFDREAEKSYPLGYLRLV
jgi:hypothetical protein